MSAMDMPGIIILAVLAAGLIVFFIVVARKEAGKVRAGFSQYQKQFKMLSVNYALQYNKQNCGKLLLPVVNGSIGQVTINYGLKYNRKAREIQMVLFFWRSDLAEFFPCSDTATDYWVHPLKSFTDKDHLAFGIYLQSYIPFKIRLKKNAINENLEKKYTLTGESVETAVRYLTPDAQQFLENRINYQEDYPFYLHVYYDEKGPAYGKIEKGLPLTRTGIIEDFPEFIKLITPS